MANKNILFAVFDNDLPPQNRTLANYWQSEYYKCLLELQKANKALTRKARTIKNLRAAIPPRAKPAEVLTLVDHHRV